MQLVDLWYVNLDPFGPYSTVGPQSRGSCPCINTIRCEPFPEDGKGVRRRELAGIPCRLLTGRGGLAGVLEWVQPPRGGGTTDGHVVVSVWWRLGSGTHGRKA